MALKADRNELDVDISSFYERRYCRDEVVKLLDAVP